MPILKPLALLLLLAATQQNEDGTIVPEVAVQRGDYAGARARFRTNLRRHGPSPQHLAMPAAPAGVTEADFASGPLRLRAWIGFPEQRRRRMPVVIFLHGGFGFGIEDWEMAAPYRAAGFVVVMPILRGENGQAGEFSLFYDEVADVLAAEAFVRDQPYADRRHIYLAGHSIGGTLALLAAEASGRFRAVASLSASPDQIIFTRHGIRPGDVPFDPADMREQQMRSPLAYAASVRVPVRLYFGTREAHWRLSSRRLVAVARAAGRDVELNEIEGGHESAVPEEIRRSIAFFGARR
jgi:dipeptidyl aminopeptidase/acylaminoacyl peptidase